MHDIGVDYRSSIGIAVEGTRDATVAHNQVNDVPYTGIWGQSPRGLRVEHNLVFDAVRKVPDGGADRVTLDRNVLYGSDDAVSGVEPKGIRITNNYWDDDTPFWWPEDTPTDGITLAGNTLLARANPAASCRADAACAEILGAAGRRSDARRRDAVAESHTRRRSASPVRVSRTTRSATRAE